MTKKEIIKKMVENGYNMMGRTEEWFEQNFTEKDLHFFLENFLKSKKMDWESPIIKPSKEKKNKKMTREQMLTAMIHLYGFEHEAVIEFARLIENPNIDNKTLLTLLIVHQECPLIDDEEE